MLAWLAREGWLEVRVGVMRLGGGILHAKFGLFTDGAGDAVVFAGSGNENHSVSAHQRNGARVSDRYARARELRIDRTCGCASRRNDGRGSVALFPRRPKGFDGSTGIAIDRIHIDFRRDVSECRDPGGVAWVSRRFQS